MTVLISWYAHHLKAGGERDPVADELFAETQDEDQTAWDLRN